MNSKEYEEGYTAHMNGIAKCPYETGTKQSGDWWDGWAQAEQDNIEDGLE